MSKNFDSSCPIGPCLVSDEEFGEAGEPSFRCSVNGRVVQSGTLSALKTRFNTVLSSISQTMTLTAGDVIGIAIEENGFLRLQAGDAVQFEVEEIGGLDNQVVLST